MKLNLCQQRKTEAGPKTPCALKLQSSPQLGLHRKLTKILPLPFGRGEGSRCVVHPTIPSVGRKLRSIGCGALVAAAAGCTTYIERPQAEIPPPPPPVYVEPPREVYAPQPTVEAVVEIRVESDFYEPLGPYGRWEFVAPYGRCWIPGRVESNWRPYCNGHWERTERGWYWASDEPWAWAAYHYGRWDWRPDFGWFWVPQVQWAPAWVSWHQSDGCIGWAPLHPSARFGAGGVLEVNERMIPPRAFVFVEERRFLDPIRPATVINNTTIINKTVNITNIKVVNNTIINEGPRTEVIERASGRRVQAVPARELRSKSEAPVASHLPAPARVREKIAQPPPVVRNQPVPHEPKPAVTTEPRPAEKSVTAMPPPARTPAPVREPTEVKKPVPPPAQVKPEVARQQPPQAPTEPKPENRARPAAQHEQPAEKKGQPLSELRPGHEPVGRESKTNLVHKPQKKTEEQPRTPEKN